MIDSPELQRSRDHNRVSRRLLEDLREETWGWVICRTTYHDDAAFHKAIDILTSWIKHGVYEDIHTSRVPNADPTPNNQLWARHQFTVLEDAAALDGVSRETAQAHFEGWVDAQGKRDRWNKYRVCIIVDKETVQRLSETAMTPEEHKEQHGAHCFEHLTKWYVPVVEAFPDLEEGDPEYEGWMNCSVSSLFRLWHSMDGGSYMGVCYTEVNDGVY